MNVTLRRLRNMARPSMMWLEPREQPGSLLGTGLDLGVLGPWSPESGISVRNVTELPSLRRSLTAQSEHLAVEPIENSATSPELVVHSVTLTTQQRTVARPQSSAQQLPSPNSSIPPKRALTSSANVRTIMPAADINVSTAPQAQGRRYEVSSIQQTPARQNNISFPTKVESSSAQVADVRLIAELHDCESVGSKVPVFNTYEGTPGADENLAVASGKAAFTGFSYTVGYKGPIGTVTRYDPFGACGPVFTVASPTGAPVEIRDVAVNSLGVYVVGTIAPDATAFIYWLSPALAPLGSFALTPPPGGTISLNGVGLSPTTAIPNVYATGHLFDPLGPGHDETLVLSFTSVLAPLCFADIDFGTGSRGRSIDADRAQNKYVAGIIDAFGVPNHALGFRLNAGCPGVIPWVITPGPAAPIFDPDNGLNGVRVIGGASGAAGAYFTGSMASAVVNPGFDNQLISKHVLGTGVPFYSGVFSAVGADLSGRANVVDRAGDHFTASYIGMPGAHDALLMHFDPLGVPLAPAMLGGPGFDDKGKGIDLRTTAPGDDVFMAGYTTTPSALQFPFPAGCDVTYNGGLDGFNAKWMQPLP